MNLGIMHPSIVIGGAVAILLTVFLTVALVKQKRRQRTQSLKLRFGHEYDLLLRQSDSRKKAEARLLAREKRAKCLKIRDLKPTERAQLLSAWEVVQSRFISQPRGTVMDADKLINAALTARGFPAEGFEQRAADLSVDHANLVDAYRSASEITMRAGNNGASTEELRMAMLYYRALFIELLQIETFVDRRAVA